jgi:DNA-binding Lrp family transcriptional regulator
MRQTPDTLACIESDKSLPFGQPSKGGLVDAYILVQTEPGLATTVMNALVESEIVDRALVITGAHDVFARVNDVEWDELKERLLTRLQRVPGIVRSETSIVVPAESVARIAVPRYPVFHRIASGIDALVFVKIAAGTGSDVVRELADSAEVLGMAITTGNYDLIVQIHAGSIQRLASTVLKRIQSIPGVVDTTTSLIVAATPLKEGPSRARRRSAGRKGAGRTAARRPAARRPGTRRSTKRRR